MLICFVQTLQGLVDSLAKRCKFDFSLVHFDKIAIGSFKLFEIFSHITDHVSSLTVVCSSFVNGLIDSSFSDKVKSSLSPIKKYAHNFLD